jgi:hypothetical protein
MEAIGGIAALAVLIGIGVLVQYLRNQATKALTRGIFERGNHSRGQTITKETVEFSAPVPPERVVTAVRERLALRTDPPAAFVAVLYLAEWGTDALVFKFGNKASQTFRAMLMSENAPGGGSRTVYRVTDWVEGDGIVRGIAEMELLANTVRAVGGELGGAYGSTPVMALADAAMPKFCVSCGSAQLGERFCTACGAPIG